MGSHSILLSPWPSDNGGACCCATVARGMSLGGSAPLEFAKEPCSRYLVAEDYGVTKHKLQIYRHGMFASGMSHRCFSCLMSVSGNPTTTKMTIRKLSPSLPISNSLHISQIGLRRTLWDQLLVPSESSAETAVAWLSPHLPEPQLGHESRFVNCLQMSAPTI